MTWWRELYDERVAAVLLDAVDDAESEATADFLVERLGLRAGDRVLDQCAGTGRLSAPLAARGLAVVAVEQADAYVRAIRERAPAVEALAGDAFEFVARPPCAAAFNWWTSFGYLADDADNIRMLRRAFESVQPGGRFALDFLNVPQIFRSFRGHEVTQRAGLTLTRDTRLDLARGLMHKRWQIDPGGIVRDTTVRAYQPHELVRLAEQAGFTDVALVGSIRGEPLELDSRRCILLARRP
ncbi:MAG TPA: class I SAM-dependent methyltransferase [Polyangia bacterium]|nr:class I SAM-dependent methyltransferase [Polyangia bacterium]